jgi:hypothetical protein
MDQRRAVRVKHVSKKKKDTRSPHIQSQVNPVMSSTKDTNGHSLSTMNLSTRSTALFHTKSVASVTPFTMNRNKAMDT